MVQLVLGNFRILKCDDILTNFYQIDEVGNIMNIKTKKYVKPHPDKNGYLHLMLCTNERLSNGEHKRKDYRIATLVIKTFVGEAPKTMLDPTVDHKDGNVLNNHYSNLRWMERGVNSSIRKNKGTGSQNHEAKLDEHDVVRILELLQEGKLSFKQIGTIFGVTKSTINNIARGKTWKHVSSSGVA